MPLHWQLLVYTPGVWRAAIGNANFDQPKAASHLCANAQCIVFNPFRRGNDVHASLLYRSAKQSRGSSTLLPLPLLLLLPPAQSHITNSAGVVKYCCGSN
jgi:hypothetical protein